MERTIQLNLSEAFLHLRPTQAFGEALQAYRKEHPDVTFKLKAVDGVVVDNPFICTEILAEASRLIGTVELSASAAALPDLDQLTDRLNYIIADANHSAEQDLKWLSDELKRYRP